VGDELRLPDYDAIERALLRYLAAHGPAIPRNVYLPLADEFGLSRAQRLEQRPDNTTPLWNNRVQWARKSLKDKGYLSGSLRIWEHSEEGLEASRRDNPPSANDFDVLDIAEIDISADEGRALLQSHRRRERSAELIRKFKASLDSYTCEACGEDMQTIYGELGAGYIEAHHRLPVSQLREGQRTSLSDLAAVCANCHRVIHRNGLITVEALRAHINKRRER
jgi:predicted HNH restriction endonuclease